MRFNKEGAMKDVDVATDPVSIASLVIAGVALGWQVWRDLKKDKDEKKRKET